MITNLPVPPSGKTGWPWTEESKPMPPLMPDGKPWPKISIVTPSYNQGQFLEETIRSVLLQNYPNLEYIIMDGGSTDNSVEIIRKYEPLVTYWVSEKDKGQADAIQRGFDISTGDIIAWINSDDVFLREAFMRAAQFFIKHDDKELLIGSSFHITESGTKYRKFYGFPQHFESLLLSGMHFNQPACFWLRSVYTAVGGLNTDLRFAFDYDFLLRVTKRGLPGFTFYNLAALRYHMATKTSRMADIGRLEAKQIREKYAAESIENRAKLTSQTYRQINLYRLWGRFMDIVLDPSWLCRDIGKRITALFINAK